MLEALAMKLLTGLHLVGVGTFFAWALFLAAAVLPALRYIPPDQAAKLSLVVEPRFLLVSNVSLGLVAVTGLLQMTLLGLWSQLGDSTFLASTRGQALVASLVLWVVLAASQAWYVLRLRRHLSQGFPFDVSRTSEGVSAETARATSHAHRILQAQAIVCMVAVILIGGAVRYGG